MNIFIQKQIEASERLYHMMMEDHKARFDKLAAVYDLSEHLQKKLAERDAEIATLRRQLRAYEIMERT
jgi:ABC-type enterochelin transport system substrate-binding protein